MNDRGRLLNRIIFSRGTRRLSRRPSGDEARQRADAEHGDRGGAQHPPWRRGAGARRGNDPAIADAEGHARSSRQESWPASRAVLRQPALADRTGSQPDIETGAMRRATRAESGSLPIRKARSKPPDQSTTRSSSAMSSRPGMGRANRPSRAIAHTDEAARSATRRRLGHRLGPTPPASSSARMLAARSIGLATSVGEAHARCGERRGELISSRATRRLRIAWPAIRSAAREKAPVSAPAEGEDVEKVTEERCIT